MKVARHRTPVVPRQQIAWRTRVAVLIAVLVTTAGALAVVASPVAAGGPVEVTYPSGGCPQELGLQSCIDSYEAGSTIHIVTEIVNEDIVITGSITLLGAQGFAPIIDSFDITGSTSAIDVTLRGLAVEGGIWAKFTGAAGHTLTIQRVTVRGTVPNTGSGITAQTTVPVSFILERSTILKAVNGHDNVDFDTNLASGSTMFRAVGNRLTQHGSNGSMGFFVRHVQAGTHQVDLMNNRIWDVAACGCGLASGIAFAVAGIARVDANIVGNTIERSAGTGIMLRNDLDPEGSFAVDIFDNIIAHAQGRAIARDSLTGATTIVRNGYNDVFSTASSPTSPSFGPGTRFVEPRFVDRSTGKLRLRASSPLIDRGRVCTPGGLANPDAAGHHRVAGGRIDIGAYEFGATAPTGIVVVGDDAPETHVGTPGADIFCGYAGEDAIDGKGGRDFLDGGGDADTLIGSGGPDQLFGRGGPDLLCANDGHGNDRLHGGSATDRFRADPGDTLISVEQPDPCTAQ